MPPPKSQVLFNQIIQIEQPVGKTKSYNVQFSKNHVLVSSLKNAYDTIYRIQVSSDDQIGFITFSIYNDPLRVYIQNIKCNVKSLKGTCSNVMMCILAQSVLSLVKPKIPLSTPITLDVVPDTTTIQNTMWSEIRDDEALKIPSNIALKAAFHKRGIKLSQEDLQKPFMELFLKYFSDPGVDKLIKLYTSLGFASDRVHKRMMFSTLEIVRNALSKKKHYSIIQNQLFTGSSPESKRAASKSTLKHSTKPATV
jgi:hypothetical protein